MFDISLIPMFVYIFIFIPPIIIGALKGWKISIFYTLILFGLMSGVFLILSTTYEAWVFRAFDFMFIKPKIVKGVDSNLLSEFTKQSAIGLFAAIAMPFMMLFAWLIFKLLTKNRKIFNFFYRDKSTVIAPNEVEIIKDLHTKKHYILGSVAGTIQGLYLSAIFVTASATMTMPASSSDFFVNSSNVLAQLFSFGQAGYSVDYQYAYDWMASATSEYFSSFDFIVNIFDSAKRPTEEQMIEFESSLLARDLENFYSNETMSNLIIASLAENIAIDGIKVLDESAPGNPNGIPSLEKDNYIATIEAWNTANNFSIKMNPKAAENFILHMKTAVASFEDTRFYTEWDLAWKNENDALISLNNKRSELSNLKIVKTNLESKIERLTNEIAKATADLGTAGTDLAKKEEARDTALNERNIAETDMLSKQTAKDNALSEMQNAQTNVNNIEVEIASIDYQINLENATIAEADREMPRLQTAITSLTSQISTLQTERQTASADRIIVIDQLIAQKTNEKQAAQDSYNQYSQNKTNAISNKASLTTQKTTKTNELNTAKAVLATKTSVYNTALSAFNVANTNFTNKDTAYNRAEASYQAALEKLNGLNGDIVAKNNEKTETQNLLQDTISRITTLEANSNTNGSIARDEVLHANAITARKPLSVIAFGVDGGDDTASAVNAKNQALEGSKKKTYDTYLERYLDVYRAILK